MKGLSIDGPLGRPSNNDFQTRSELDDNASEASNEENFNQNGSRFLGFQKFWHSKSHVNTRSRVSKFVAKVNSIASECLRSAVALKPLTSGLLWTFITTLLFTLFLISIIHTWRNQNFLFSCVALGGRFSQLQAKSIDFIVGAVAVPILIAVANLCCFIPSKRFAARADGQAVTLVTLVELATTSSGSYNPKKLFILGRSLRPRDIFFSCLVLLSAITYTLLTNVIAYEVYTSASIQTLRDRPWNLKFTKDEWAGLQTKLSTYLNTAAWPGFYDRDVSKRNELSFTYANISQHFLWNNVSDTISTLWQVPAYRHTMECRPALFDFFSVQVLSDRSLRENLIDFSMGSFRTDSDFFARIPGNMTNLNTTQTFYNIVAFKNPWKVGQSQENDFSPKILFTTFTDTANPLKPPGSTTQTLFGKVPHFTFDLYYKMKKWKTVEVWGVECTRYQMLGRVNVTRLGGPQEHTYGQRDWVISEPQFTPRIPLNYTYLSLINTGSWGVQPLAPSYHWSSLPLGGIGSPLAAYTCNKRNLHDSMPPLNCVPDFSRWAFNFLYTAVEMERFVAELADAPGRSTAGKQLVGNPYVGWPKPIVVQPPEMLEVSTTDTVPTYRMCYIPALWTGAVAAMLMASCVPLLLICTRKRNSGIDITPLRLVVDCARALKDDGTVEDMASWSTKTLDRWSKSTRVRYQLHVSENEGPAPTCQLVLDSDVRYSHDDEGEEEVLLLGDHPHPNDQLI